MQLDFLSNAIRLHFCSVLLVVCSAAIPNLVTQNEDSSRVSKKRMDETFHISGVLRSRNHHRWVNFNSGETKTNRPRYNLFVTICPNINQSTDRQTDR